VCPRDVGVLTIDVAAAVGQQQSHDSRVATHSGERQRGAAVAPCTHSVRPMRQEQGHHGVIPLEACLIKGGQAIGSPEVDLGPLTQQAPDHPELAIQRSLGERRAVAPIGVQQPPVLLYEAPHLLDVSPPGGHDDPGVAHRGFREA
jgi:hypothetical protein